MTTKKKYHYEFVEDLVLNGYKQEAWITPKFESLPNKSIHRQDIYVDVQVRLERKKDQKSRKRKQLANDVKNEVKALLRTEFPGDKKLAKYHLNVFVVLASEGSANARMWAAELGMGYVKECLAWILSKQEDTSVLTYGREMVTDHGACGCADLCNSRYGEDALTGRLADLLVSKIIKKIRSISKT